MSPRPFERPATIALPDDPTLAPGASEDARSLTAEWTAPRWDGVLSGLLT